MQFVQYQVVDKVGVITLDRGDKANAQTTALLTELDSCWDRAVADTGVNVILLQANGRHFSAGMDLSRNDGLGSEASSPPGSGYYNAASLHFFGNTLAWRNAPKPSIAAVQGKCVAAGLMLCWPCDLIIAADNAEFSDPTMRMGLAGIQYMAHAWELGPRKAKEMLLRSTPISAQEAEDLGMVNKVVPLADLRDEAMSWARDIACLDPTMAALIKRGINAAIDGQGFSASLTQGFDLQELGYALQAATRASADGDGATDLLEHMRETNADIARRETSDTQALPRP
ncbi:MAG: Enoyl-CoA hydratase/isomerase [Acidimicrobiales bacterium]|nr:Enoyl-CoA hydratase/isomerase [Acidimicrobiales bacterium]